MIKPGAISIGWRVLGTVLVLMGVLMSVMPIYVLVTGRREPILAAFLLLAAAFVAIGLIVYRRTARWARITGVALLCFGLFAAYILPVINAHLGAQLRERRRAA